MASRPAKTENRLWIARVKRGLPRKKLAALLGQDTTSQLCRWEAGNQVPTLANALVLGYLLEAPVEELFAGLSERLRREVDAQRGTAEDDGETDSDTAGGAGALESKGRRIEDIYT